MLKCGLSVVAALLVIASLQMTSAHAQAYSWNGGSGSWGTSTMWTPNGIPGAGDDVTVNAGIASDVTVTANSCRTLIIGGGSTTQKVQMPTSSLTISTSCTINSLGTIETGYMGSIGGAGTLTNNSGLISMLGGTISLPTVNNNAITNFDVGLAGCVLSSVTFNNAGSVDFKTNNTMTLTSSTINNSGVFVADTNQTITGTGTISNTGSFAKSSATSGTLTINSGIAFSNGTVGGIVIASGSSLFFGNLTNFNSGTSTLNGGSYSINGVMQIGNATGLLSTSAALISLGTSTATINNNGGSPMLMGLSKISAGGTLSLAGSNNLTCTGTTFQNDGIVFVSSGSTFNSGSGKLTVSASGAIDPSGGAIVATGGIDIQGGILIGNGTITGNVNNNGIVSASSGTLNISGNYTQTAMGELIASFSGVGGPAALSCTGAATLDGTLEPAVSYAAATGDTLFVVHYGTVSGQFATIFPQVTSNNFLLSQQVTAASVNLVVGGAAPTTPPVIVSATADSDAVAVGVTVNFSAVVTDTSGLPLTYTWDFGDGTPHANGATVSHVFTSEALWNVTLIVTNGVTSATTTLDIMALGPNSGGAGIPNLGDGQSTSNPLNGLSITLTKSDGGLCQFSIDINALIRSAFTVSTDFDTISGRNSTVTGLTPAFKADNSNIYIATTTATDSSTNAVAGKGRKTVGMSGAEVGDAPKVKTPPKNHLITNSSTKGKFNFGKPTGAGTGTPDSVIFTGTFELPEGLDLSASATQLFQFSIGNILDSVTINSKGKTVGKTSSGRIKKLTISFPKLKKGVTLTTAGQMAKFSVTINQVGLSAAGFDTEGITNTYAATEKSLKSVKRSLQVAMVFAGVVWEASAPVTYTLSAKGDSGSMAGRSGQ